MACYACECHYMSCMQTAWVNCQQLAKFLPNMRAGLCFHQASISTSKYSNTNLLQAATSKTYDSPALDEKALQIYSSNPAYQYVSVPGHHHVHLNSPEVVAPHIQQFVQKHFSLKNKL